LRFQQHFDADLAGRDLAQRDDVALSRSVSTSGALPAEIWRARLVAASVSSKRLGILSRQSSMVMRAMEIL
jgi:hypothetical protein